MHILYLDDSGSSNNKKENYLVLGGLSIYEAQARHFTQELDKLALTLNPRDPHAVEFHASDIFGGREEPWKRLSKDERIGVIKEVLKILANSFDSARVFACAVHKASYPGRDPMEIAFEDLCSRFDLFLNRLKMSGDRQRGLIILDESSYETSLQKMARNFEFLGRASASFAILRIHRYLLTRRPRALCNSPTMSPTRYFGDTKHRTLPISISSRIDLTLRTIECTDCAIDMPMFPHACAPPV